jgi:hypothetical protein
VRTEAAVALVLGLALALAHGATWRHGAGEVVPLVDPGVASLDGIVRADVIYQTWLGARQARTWLGAPWRLFETEHCAPSAHSLTVGIPMLGLGLLGAPAALATSNPIRLYNIELLLQSAVSALAMLALATRWTGSRAAGLVAALLFAFHPIRLGHIIHPTVWDISWTVLAVLFAERLLRQGRWRDSAGLAAAIALQIATDFYPLVAASLSALPLGVWLWLRRVPRRASPLQLALPVASAALAAWWVLGPYLAARRSGMLADHAAFFLYARWWSFLPGGTLYFGFALMALGLFGLAARRRTLPGVPGDPRPALVIGAVLSIFVAAGPDTSEQLARIVPFLPRFDPHALLAAVVPGLSSVRGAERLVMGALWIACVLAGAGSARLLALAGRRRRAAAGALVALALVACFGLPFGWLAPDYRLLYAPIHPEPERIAFFEELARQGSEGPVFELPFDAAGGHSALLAPPRILLSAWHGRRTSACFGSVMPPEHAELEQLALRLPERAALARLRQLGFTSVLVHHELGPKRARHWLEPFERATEGADPALRLLLRSRATSAYAIVAEAAH